MATKVNTGKFKRDINDGAYRVAAKKAKNIEAKAKKNMDPLYKSNSPWSYRGLADPSIESDKRSGLARASIHSWEKRTEYWIRVGSTADVMQEGVDGIAGSPVFYFPYLEFGTTRNGIPMMPPLAMLRKAFDEEIRS